MVHKKEKAEFNFLLFLIIGGNMKNNFVVKMNREQRRSKKASRVAQWIVDTILKLDNEHLIEFYNLISDELRKRGVA